jgi:carbamoyl-phosphate synthase small subunit
MSQADYGWDSILYLEQGHVFEGQGFGARSSRGGEIVFNTGMAGYQEIFTDLSYYEQIVVMTYPHIGNTGINAEDIESAQPALSGVVVREYCPTPSNWRSSQTLAAYLAKAGVPGISDIDTRELTRLLRTEGAQRAVVFEKKAGVSPAEEGRRLLGQVPSMEGLELVSKVSCRQPYVFHGDSSSPTVAVYDYGVKRGILKQLKDRGLRVWVVPYQFPHQDVLAAKPAAVVLSNGPGDPAQVPHAAQEIAGLVGRVPIFAICMGHQLMARALGAKTYKLKFGHHGVNHPVRDCRSGRILITSQNHGFAVHARDLQDRDLALTHVNLNDDTVEGFSSEKMSFQCVQFHPEAAPGPSDAAYLFDSFVKEFLR